MNLLAGGPNSKRLESTIKEDSGWKRNFIVIKKDAVINIAQKRP